MIERTIKPWEALLVLLGLSLCCAFATSMVGFIAVWAFPGHYEGWRSWLLLQSVLTLGPFLALGAACLVVHLLAADDPGVEVADDKQPLLWTQGEIPLDGAADRANAEVRGLAASPSNIAKG